MGYRSIHREFYLNGSSYSKEELRTIAYDLVKEGESFEQSIGDFLLDWLDSKSYVEVYTSGSTGDPKRIELQKSHMLNSAKATGGFFDLQAGNSCLLCLSADFIAGKMMLVRAMVLGLKLDYVEPTSNPLEHNNRKYDFCAMVPLQLQNSLNKLDNIKTLIVGGAPITKELKVQEQVQNQHTQIFETYGMTETVTHVAVKRLKNIRLSAVEAVGKANTPKPENNFMALPNVHFSLDERNCLVIKAPKVNDDPIVTNDVVKLFSDTEFEWLGRYDNVINSGGVKLFPEQIEAKLEPIMPSRFFVAGLPDEKLGKKLVLLIEGTLESDKLFQKIKSLGTLQKFEVPKAIHVIPTFLETETGKIRRKQTLGIIKK